MENNNLKGLWKEIHNDTEIKSVDIKEVIRKKHCHAISHTLRRQKTLIYLLILFLTVLMSTSVWDIVIMKNVSLSLWTGNAFLLVLLVSSIGHYQLLTRSADLYSVKESGTILKKQLERRIGVDFIIYLIFFYGTTVRFIIRYINDYDGLKGLSFIIILFVALFLSLPSLIKHQQKRRYRNFFNLLNENQKLLEV